MQEESFQIECVGNLVVTIQGQMMAELTTDSKTNCSKQLKTISRKDGIQAIMDIHSLFKVKEPKRVIAKRWDGAPAQEKENTIRAHRMCFPEKYEKPPAK